MDHTRRRLKRQTACITDTRIVCTANVAKRVGTEGVTSREHRGGAVAQTARRQGSTREPVTKHDVRQESQTRGGSSPQDCGVPDCCPLSGECTTCSKATSRRSHVNSQGWAEGFAQGGNNRRFLAATHACFSWGSQVAVTFSTPPSGGRQSAAQPDWTSWGVGREEAASKRLQRSSLRSAHGQPGGGASLREHGAPGASALVLLSQVLPWGTGVTPAVHSHGTGSVVACWLSRSWAWQKEVRPVGSCALVVQARIPWPGSTSRTRTRSHSSGRLTPSPPGH